MFGQPTKELAYEKKPIFHEEKKFLPTKIENF